MHPHDTTEIAELFNTEVPTLFRPQFRKVKTSSGFQIQQASNTLTRREGICDKMPDVGSGFSKGKYLKHLSFYLL